MTVDEIARALEGVVEGDGAVEVTGLAGLKDAGAGELSFLANPRYASAMAVTGASAVIVSESWEGTCRCAVIKVKDPDKAFAVACGFLAPLPVEAVPGVHPTAVVAGDVELGGDVTVGPYCVLEQGVGVGSRTVLFAGCYVGHGTALGEDCRLYSGVSVRERVRIGDRVVIHNGAVIGSDGFGYYRDEGKWKKIPQMGTVVIGDDVEIGANTVIDRARFGKTVIGNGVKIDNLVQIAHNVSIGDDTAIAGQAGISGSVEVGRNVQIGGQAGFGGHLSVGDDAIVGGQAGVTKDVGPGTFVSGYPAMLHNKAMKTHAHVMRLPELKKKVAALEKRLSGIEERAK